MLGWFSKNKIFASRNQQFYISMLKQVLRIYKCTKNIKILSEIGKKFLKNGIEAKMFKYFLKICIYWNKYIEIWIKVVYKLDQKDWVQNLNFILDRLAFYNLMQNICKIINRFIPKKNRRATTSFLRSEQQIHICKIFTVFFSIRVFFRRH